ncbi:conserved exported hypothetical protein [uncultured Mycobacterium sp.]|uniref:PE-PGRS family protein n=1 Tax=uncultured Mycobacterium sp. TaxID=171292 RepID=A0A1Y5P8V7_9MYCO|nr:conserved exported hypothetical protein [uncultured Mycobacterium sp.]
MPMLQACVAGMATSVLAAGVITANSDVAREPSVPTAPSIELTASTIPLIDFTGKLGPLTVTRKLTAGFNIPPNLLAGLEGQADTAWTAPIGPTGEVKNSLLLPITLATTAPIVDLGFEPDWKSAVMVSPLGAAGPTIDLAPELKSKTHLIQYRGGPDGYGFGVNGTLLEAGLQGGATSPATMIGGSAIIGEYKAQLSVIPFSGLKAALSFSPYSGGGGASIQLGTTKIGTTLPSGQLKFDSQLCLGSAAASCGGVIAQVSLSAMLGGTLIAINSTDVISYDFPDSLKIELKAGSLAITGNIGGTVKVGQATVGGVIPINIHIPPAPPVVSVSAVRKSQTAAAQDSVKSAPVRSKATSRKSATDGGTESAKSPKPAAKHGAGSNRPARD